MLILVCYSISSRNRSGRRVTCFEALRHPFFEPLKHDIEQSSIGKQVALHVGRWEGGGWSGREGALRSILDGYIAEFREARKAKDTKNSK